MSGYGLWFGLRLWIGADGREWESWAYNPWYGMFTYMPYGNGMYYSPFGYPFYSPTNVGYYVPSTGFGGSAFPISASSTSPHYDGNGTVSHVASRILRQHQQWRQSGRQFGIAAACQASAGAAAADRRIERRLAAAAAVRE